MAIINGTNGNDTLTGTAAADTISGFAGVDRLYGLAGDDRLIGGAGDDYLYGGDGRDFLDYSNETGRVQVNLAANVAVDGTGGIDRLDSLEVVVGSRFNDYMLGSDRAETFSISNGGNDVVDGGGGFDTVNLAGYSDTTVDLFSGTYSTGSVAGRVINIESVLTGSGMDTVYGSNADNQINAGGGDDTVYGRNGNDSITLGAGDDVGYGNDGNDAIIGGDGSDSLFGQADNDVLYGGNGDDYLDGGLGKDQLYGGDGDDILQASWGNDIVDGGAGNDVIYGDGGDDRLTGGDGADIFVRYRYGGLDTITDFNPSTDQVQISGEFNASSYSEVMSHATQVGNNAVLTFTNGQSITFLNTLVGQLTSTNIKVD